MSSADHLSVSNWLRNLEQGDSDAAQKLWERYFEKLVHQAQKRLQNCPPGVTGAEDVAVSVFESLWRGAQAGRFASVQDRDELWWLLLALTRRKVANHVRHACTEKRGGDSVPQSLDAGQAGFDFLVSPEPSPEYAMTLDEEYQRLLGLLRDDKLRQIAALKLEGQTNQTISEQLGIASATVTRKVRLIRDTWQHELGQ